MPSKKKELTEAQLAATEATVLKKRTTPLSSMLAAESQETQVLLHDIARLVNIFKTEINEDPAIVAYLMRKVNPVFTEEALFGVLNQGQAPENTSLSKTIVALQDQVKSLNNIVQINSFWTTMFNVVTYGFLSDMPWHKIVLYGAYISNKSMI